jgi:ketosteroid isomerase-like protein
MELQGKTALVTAPPRGGGAAIDPRERALGLARRFFAGFEARDPAAVGETLADDATVVIRLNIDGTPDPWYVFDGKAHVLAYIGSVSAKFDRVAFIDKQWTVAADASSIFLQANGDIISSAEKLSYRNVYVFKVELQGDKILRVVEYANPVTYANLGIKNSESEEAAQAR